MPGKATQKALALSSIVAVIIKRSGTPNGELSILRRQIERAMKVYSYKAPDNYVEVINSFKDVWDMLGEKHTRILSGNEPGRFIEYICSMLPESSFKSFLGVKRYIERGNISEETEQYLRRATLDLELELNKIFGTKPSTELITTNKEKITKTRKRDKSKKKPKTQVVSSSKVKEGQRRKNVRGFLRDRIEQAKEI